MPCDLFYCTLLISTALNSMGITIVGALSPIIHTIFYKIQARRGPTALFLFVKYDICILKAFRSLKLWELHFFYYLCISFYSSFNNNIIILISYGPAVVSYFISIITCGLLYMFVFSESFIIVTPLVFYFALHGWRLI